MASWAHVHALLMVVELYPLLSSLSVSIRWFGISPVHDVVEMAIVFVLSVFGYIVNEINEDNFEVVVELRAMTAKAS